MKTKITLFFVIITLVGIAQSEVKWGGAFYSTGTHQNLDVIKIDKDNSTFAAVNILGASVDFDLEVGLQTAKPLNASATVGVVVKYDDEGVLQWANGFKSDSRIYDIALYDDGRIGIVGIFKGQLNYEGQNILTGSSTQWNAFFITISSIGVYLDGFALNASSDTRLYGVSIDSDESIYLTGYSTGELDLDKSSGKSIVPKIGNSKVGFVAKYDESNMFLWGKIISGINGKNKSFGGTCFQSTQNDSLLFVVGDVYPNINLKIGNTTRTVRVNLVIKSTNTSSILNSETPIQLNGSTSTGLITIFDKQTGAFEKVVPTTPFSSTELQKTNTLREIEYSSIDSTIVFAGYANGKIQFGNNIFTPNSSQDVGTGQLGFLGKYKVVGLSNQKASLQLEWIRTYQNGLRGLAKNHFVKGIAIDSTDGSIHTIGETRFGFRTRLLTSNVGSVHNIENTTQNTNNDVLYTKLSKGGTVEVHKRYADTDIMGGYSIALTSENEITYGGYMRGKVNFSRSQNPFNINTSNSSFNTVFIVQEGFKSVTNSLSRESVLSELSFYPNPVNDVLVINGSDNFLVKIYNLHGFIMVQTDNRIIDVSQLAKGTYILQMETEERVLTKRFIKE